eukprot:PhF_6_TR35374/c1_g1_i14/m.51390
MSTIPPNDDDCKDAIYQSWKSMFTRHPAAVRGSVVLLLLDQHNLLPIELVHSALSLYLMNLWHFRLPDNVTETPKLGGDHKHTEFDDDMNASFTRSGACGSAIIFLEPVFELTADMAPLSVTLAHSAFKTFSQSFRLYNEDSLDYKRVSMADAGGEAVLSIVPHPSESGQYEFKVTYPRGTSKNKSKSVNVAVGTRYRFAVYTFVSPFTCVIAS